MLAFVSIVNLLKKKVKPKKSNILRKLLLPISIILVVVALDQISKIWALGYLAEIHSVNVFGDFFKLTLVYNEGGAMGSSFGSSNYYLISSILILLFVFYYIYTNRDNLCIAYPLAFISGGALGNIIDRIAYGKVVDFLDFDFFDINIGSFRLERWWTFNIADAVISCSIIFLLIILIFYNPKKNSSVTPQENNIHTR